MPEEIKTMPTSAYMIINSEVFPLDKPIMNIGRKLDNHIVINDPRISRNHAQLRFVDGQFVLLDMNSTGGTFVNEQKVNKSVLYSGDSISLAGVGLKFVQDTPKMISKAMDRTGPLPPLEIEEQPATIVAPKIKGTQKPMN